MVGAADHGDRAHRDRPRTDLRSPDGLFGGVAFELLQWAPRSALDARRPTSGHAFPRELVIGIEDSRSPSKRALAIARLTERRFRSSVRTSADSRGKSFDPSSEGTAGVSGQPPGGAVSTVLLVR